MRKKIQMWNMDLYTCKKKNSEEKTGKIEGKKVKS